MDTSFLWIFLISFINMQYLQCDADVSLDNWESLNEYDTYYADECPRMRRGWHTLSDQQRGLYINGLMKIRENGQQNIDIDEVIAIGSVHADVYAPFIHKTSSYLYWHGYLTWEIESRIRALGGEYKCFGMPYWDFTLEAGRESDPLILQTGLGGNGNVNDHYKVNEYSWPYTTGQYWTPTDCFAEDDNYPLCSLKRALRKDFQMPTAKTIGENIINNPNFEDFAQFSHISGQAVHLIDGCDDLDENGDPIYEFTQSYEPIWYLFHSMIQYHQAAWTDCNNYDQIPVNELEKYPEAFTPFCNSYDTCTLNNNGYPQRWLQWKLDDPMHFGGKLIKHEWSYINKNDLTVRKLYNLPKWNIVYDLGNGDGFWTDSGLRDYCDGKLNSSWFILNEGHVNDDNDKYLSEQQLSSLSSSSYISQTSLVNLSYNDIFVIIFCLISSICCALYFIGRYKKLNNNIGINKDKQHLNKYGAVTTGTMKSIYIS
mmetsp:Transcript_37531/g.33167  ORF Transcript_37531/g.33167 Transcript_37531/m.33167 type:complete len:484 (+) Transcript_37531:31-1482(+)